MYIENNSYSRVELDVNLLFVEASQRRDIYRKLKYDVLLVNYANFYEKVSGKHLLIV